MSKVEPSLILRLCGRMRSILGFMQKNLRVYAQLDIESAANWQ